MEQITIKKESKDIIFHLSLNIDEKGKVFLQNEKLNISCPTCSESLIINLIVNDNDFISTKQSNYEYSEFLSLNESTTEELCDIKLEESEVNIEQDPTEMVLVTVKRAKQNKNKSDTKVNMKLHKNLCKPARKKARTKGQVCLFCFESFPSQELLLQHYIGHSVICKFCEMELPNKSKLKLHVRTKHFDQHPKFSTSIVCQLCHKTFSAEGFSIHKRTCNANNAGEPTCHICNKTFSRYTYLTTHIENIHEGKKGHTCEVCGVQFASKILLDEHSLTHIWNDPKPYKCYYCPEVAFKSRFLIKKHMQDKHLKLQPSKTCKCQECGKVYPTKYKLQEHMLRHLQIRPFHCSFCSKSFFRKDAMNDHEKIHNDVREFACDICGHRFRQKQGMLSHRRLHTGEKPYHCSICQQRFADRGCYRSHITKHEKELGVTLDKSVKKFGVTSKKPLLVPETAL